jgi:S1-C subfamily serine protease
MYKNYKLINKLSAYTTTILITILLIYELGCSNIENPANAESNQETISFEQLRKGIIHIGQQKQGSTSPTDIEKWLGTGFLVDNQCTFVTAKHVVELGDKEHLVIRFQQPQHPELVITLPIKVIYEDPDKDLAFLRIDKIGNKPCLSGELHVFSLLQDLEWTSLVGEPVWIIGHPSIFGDKQIDIPILRRGIIASTEIVDSHNGKLILLDLFGVPGFSGSPVILQKTGQVVGVIFGPGTTPRSTGFEWSTPITQKDYEKAKKH